ncbi:NAD(P)-dependent oxidoreductase [Ravibacter arvi]|uniref:NAD(P)-dependent oxidoreductase n=1 Tax=Ravibacter arvi TaxID=2051041 RepID=A0ABP8M274_9BACT
MKEKVLITGANGFIGSHLTEACLQKGFEVHAAVRKNSSMELFRSLVTPADSLKIVYPVYADREELADLFKRERYTYIVHNAGITKTRQQETYNHINAELTKNLGAAVVNAGIDLRRFVLISSLAALGPVSYAGQGDRPRPVTGYGRSKLLAETYLRAIKGLPVTVIRPTAVYGPGEKDLLIVFRLLAGGWDLSMGRKPQKLSFVYVQDLVSAILLAMKEQPGNWASFDISDGAMYERYALSDAFVRSSRVKTRRLHVPTQLVKALALLNEGLSSVSGRYPALNGDKVKELTAENWYCDITPARIGLGYDPQFSLDKGMDETVRWYRAHKWL